MVYIRHKHEGRCFRFGECSIVACLVLCNYELSPPVIGIKDGSHRRIDNRVSLSRKMLVLFFLPVLLVTGMVDFRQVGKLPHHIEEHFSMLSTREPASDCVAEITRDMIEMMLSQFDRLSDQAGFLQIELRGNGLLVRNPDTKAYEVVGVARVSPSMRETLR